MKRATFIIYEEFPLINKEVIDHVIRPFAYVRQAPYLQDSRYDHLIEEPKEIFISSASHKGLWWFDETKKNIRSMLKGDSSFFIALDYLLTIKHKIKTVRQIKNEMSKMDEIAVLEEYYNIPWGESSNAYYKLKMFDRVRKIESCFYPQREIDFNPHKNPYDLPRVEGELRLLSTDVATRAGKANDLTIIGLVRLLPTKRGYLRELCYMESHPGENSLLQALRIKQLWYDFGADYIVLDVNGAGIFIYDNLSEETEDVMRGLSYPAMGLFRHNSLEDRVLEELSARPRTKNTLEIIYPVAGTPRLNSLIAVDFRDKLQKKMWNFLIDSVQGEDYLIESPNATEFLDDKAFFLQPYEQTGLLINECINLSMVLSGGLIKLVEPDGARKDRFSAVSYANYFSSFFDGDLIRPEDDEDELTTMTSLFQTT